VAGKYLRGRTWWLTWTAANGDRCRESAGTKDERKAEILRRAKELEVEIGRPIVVDNSAPTVAELAVLFREHQERAVASSARNEQSLAHHILPRFGSQRLNEISRTAVKAWVLDRLEAASPGTARRDLATLRRMLSLAVEWELIAANPAARVTVPSEADIEGDVRWYSTDDLALLYDDPACGTIWKLYANTGMRRGEGLALLLADVDDDRLRVMSRQGARTKSRRSRVVPLNESAKGAVAELKGPHAPYLLPRLHPHTLTHYFTAYARSVGLPGSMHWLRHSFGHHWVKSGRSLRQLQLIMGHSSYSVTERYARLDTGEISVAGFEV
jgi:integrase